MNVLTNKVVVDGIVECLGYTSHGSAPFYTAAREGLPHSFIMLGSASYGASLYSVNEIEKYLLKKGFPESSVTACIEAAGVRNY